ncbi:MAG: sulfite exporter TauE/SafE family protein, partial [Luminiphilus sp.]|nr:sulfite exporter TauE/SafE family protein [Luminiphilus sp.]
MVLNNIMMVLALAMTGFLSGILAGLLGVGGGIVIVPVLFFLFQAYGVSSASAITIATATSLAIIVPTSVSSIRAHHAVGNVDFELLLRWAPFTFLGVLCGSWIVTEADGTWLAALFGVIATLSALNMLHRPSGSP